MVSPSQTFRRRGEIVPSNKSGDRDYGYVSILVKVYALLR
jgi:hypothetical protein